MFSINSYGAHVGACLPCDMAEALVSGEASVGKCGACDAKLGARVGAMDVQAPKFSFLEALVGVVAGAGLGFFIAKKMCSCAN